MLARDVVEQNVSGSKPWRVGAIALAFAPCGEEAPHPIRSAGTAEDFIERLFSARAHERYDEIWTALHPAQRTLVTRADFERCRLWKARFPLLWARRSPRLLTPNELVGVPLGGLAVLMHVSARSLVETSWGQFAARPHDNRAFRSHCRP
jgi:hypothetical protein